jgi:hypothetical protein
VVFLILSYFLVLPFTPLFIRRMKIRKHFYLFYDIVDKDFKILSPTEKQGILKTAKTLLKVQQEDTALLADALPVNEKQEGLA